MDGFSYGFFLLSRDCLLSVHLFQLRIMISPQSEGEISEALCAYVFSRGDLQVALIEEKEVGHGSTSVNTGPL